HITAAHLQQVALVEHHRAAAGPLVEVDQLEQGALARPGVTGDEQHFARRDLEADIGQGFVATGVLFADIVEAQDTHAPIMQDRRDRSVAPGHARRKPSGIAAPDGGRCARRAWPGATGLIAGQHPADLAADTGQERVAGIGAGTHRLGHHLHRGDRAGAVAGVACHTFGALDRTAVATTTTLARLALAVHRTFRRSFSARRTRGLHGSSFSRHCTLDCGGSNLLTFHTRLARATRTAFAAALAIAATTPSASTTAGTTATTAAATTLFLGGARFACFAEDLADAFILVTFLARCRG